MCASLTLYVFAFAPVFAGASIVLIGRDLPPVRRFFGEA